MKSFLILPALCLMAAAEPTGSQSGPLPAPATIETTSASLEAIPGMAEVLEAIDAYLAAPAETSSSPDAQLTLTVQDCVRMALERNPLITTAESEVAAAEARAGQTKAGLKPSLSARMNYTRTAYNNPNLNSGPLSGLGGGLSAPLGGSPLARAAQILVLSSTQRSITDEFDVPDAFRTEGIMLTQPLYTGGQVSAAVRAAEHLSKAEHARKATTQALLEFQAKQSYYDVLLATALVTVAESSVSTFQRNLADAQHMFDVGVVSRFELLRAQTELGARESDLDTARNAVRLTTANLRRLLALPQDTTLAFETRIEWQAPPTVDDALLTDAFARRPELHAIDQSIEAAEDDLRRISGQFKPQVAATVDWQNVDGGGRTQPDGWSFNLGAKWDLYAGGRRKYELAEARARIDGLRSQRADIEHLVELEINAARIQLDDAMAKIRKERGNVEQAEEGLRLAELRFEEGVGRQSDILDAELALTNARTQLVQGLRDFAVANAAMDKALGISWVPEEDPA